MLITESYREGRLSRGLAGKMLGRGFHEAEAFFKCRSAEQQPTWEGLEASGDKVATGDVCAPCRSNLNPLLQQNCAFTTL